MRAHRSTEELQEFTQDGLKTNCALLENNIREMGNNAEVLSLGNPLVMNTMNSSQWQNLLKQSTEKTPEKNDWAKATVVNPNGPNFESFLTGT